jgi:hypothetical protein
MSSAPDSEFFTEKTDAELVFLARNPTLYHPDLVNLARRELRRRGLSPDPTTELQPMGTHLPAYTAGNDDEPAPALWQRPALWVSVLAVLLLGGVLYWQNQNAARSQAAAQARKAAGPPVLVSVESRVIPAFDSLMRTQIAQELRQLPAAERTRDTVATRKYRRLAERYWKAENQTTYLLNQLRQTGPDATLPGQTSTVLEEWHRLNKALAYDHHLTPVLTERMELMRRSAYLRMDLLQTIRGHYQDGQPISNPYLTKLRDSATVMREALLSREKWTGRLRRATL